MLVGQHNYHGGVDKSFHIFGYFVALLLWWIHKDIDSMTIAIDCFFYSIYDPRVYSTILHTPKHTPPILSFLEKVKFFQSIIWYFLHCSVFVELSYNMFMVVHRWFSWSFVRLDEIGFIKFYFYINMHAIV